MHLRGAKTACKLKGCHKELGSCCSPSTKLVRCVLVRAGPGAPSV